MKMTVREWLQRGGGFTSALLAFFEEPDIERLHEVMMWHKWPLLRDLDAEVTQEEFNECFRNRP